MCDEEFDEESFQAYENDLYEDKLDSDNEIESDIEETLYSQLHYSFSLPEDDQHDYGEVGEEASGTDNRLPSPIINAVSKHSGSPSFITISDDEDNDGNDANNYSKGDDEGDGDKDADHSRVTETSPGACENWDLIDKDLENPMERGNRRGPSRYYIGTNRNPHVRCHNCNEKGHLSRDCPAPKKIINCSLCGTPGHMRKNCPNELCFNCSETGHRSFNCPQARMRWSDKCRRCFQSGHHSYVCPDIWRQYHRTTVAGIPPVEDRTNELTGPVYCYNCSAKGHFGHECTEERPGGDRTPGYIKLVVRYDRNITSRTEHERETDIPVNQKQNKKNKTQNKPQKHKKAEQEEESKRRTSWPRQGEPGDINHPAIQSKGKNKHRQKSWPFENQSENDHSISVTNKVGSKKKRKLKRRISETLESATPKSRKTSDKRDDGNSRKVRQGKNKELTMQINTHNSERSVTVNSQRDYYDRHQLEGDTLRCTIEGKGKTQRNLSDSLMRIVDDWEQLQDGRETGNRKQELSQDPSRTHRHTSREVCQHGDFSPPDDRFSPAFTDIHGRSQPDPRGLPSLPDFQSRSRSKNSHTPYQSKRKKQRSFHVYSDHHDRSFPGSDYNDSIPGHGSWGKCPSQLPQPSHHDRDYFPGHRNQKWPKKNKSRNVERGFHSKKKNFTM